MDTLDKNAMEGCSQSPPRVVQGDMRVKSLEANIEIKEEPMEQCEDENNDLHHVSSEEDGYLEDADMYVKVDVDVDVNADFYYEEDEDCAEDEEFGTGSNTFGTWSFKPQASGVPTRAKSIVAKLSQKLNSKLNGDFTPRSTESLLACLEPEVSVAAEGVVTSGGVYVCPWCPLTFSQPEAIEEHKKKFHQGHTGGNNEADLPCSHTCEVCGRTFSKSWHLKRHFIIHTGECPFKCVICGDAFATAGDLTSHEKVHVPFPCELCPKVFPSYAFLKLHMKIHTGVSENVWKCGMCEIEFVSEEILLAHQSSHGMHPGFCCEHCGESFSMKSDLDDHTCAHTLPQICPLCSKCFKQSDSLKEHMCTEHKVKPPNPLEHLKDGSGFFTCLRCNRRYSTIVVLNRHLQSTCWLKPHKCTSCGESFRGSNDLKVHMRVHTGERPFPCPECGERFTQKGNLNVHIRTHTGEKPFSCPICGRCFLKSSNLKEHMIVHRDRENRSEQDDESQHFNQDQQQFKMMPVNVKTTVKSVSKLPTEKNGSTLTTVTRVSPVVQESLNLRASIADKLMGTGVLSLKTKETIKQPTVNEPIETKIVSIESSESNNVQETIAERVKPAETLPLDNSPVMGVKRVSQMALESQNFRESIAGKLMQTGFVSHQKEDSNSFKTATSAKPMDISETSQKIEASNNLKEAIACKLMKTGILAEKLEESNNFKKAIAGKLMKTGIVAEKLEESNNFKKAIAGKLMKTGIVAEKLEESNNFKKAIAGKLIKTGIVAEKLEESNNFKKAIAGKLMKTGIVAEKLEESNNFKKAIACKLLKTGIVAEKLEESNNFKKAIAGKLMKTGIVAEKLKESNNFKKAIASKLMGTGIVALQTGESIKAKQTMADDLFGKKMVSLENSESTNFGKAIAERLRLTGTLSFDNGNVSLRLLNINDGNL